jgi:hypothetical protein
MSYQTWTKGNDLRAWADTLQSRQKLPALIRRLIHATVEKPTLTQFPADEGVQRRGWDGVVQVLAGNAWVPSGTSVWEMGVDQNPNAKAEDDYTKRTAKPGNVDPANTTFVFITPRKWEGKIKWCDEKRAENKWRDVIVWDCDDLEQWLETAPPADAWLTRMLGKLPVGVRDLSSYWVALSATSDPPLTPAIFLAGRNKAKENLLSALAGPAAEIPVSALSLQELRDFIAAIIADGDEYSVDAAAARALIVENRDAWNQVTATKNQLILIPDEQLPLDKTMIADAVNRGHHVITQVAYTYLRSSVGVRLPRADRSELQKAMEATGFGEERSQRLAREAGGCVSVLVRLSSKFAGQVTPAWAKPEEAAAILPLVLLGAWSDRNEEDRKLVERLTGDSYANIQRLATRWINEPDAPLRLVEGVYGFVSREYSWRLLSPLFTKDLLDQFEKIALEVLGEDDPRFDMPVDQRYLASFHKTLPKFSSQIREGIVETVALLGARGDQTPQGAPEGSSWRAAILVRALLENASQKRWFSLAYLLPLFAEAAPDEFLTALETDLRQPSPAITSLFEKNADGLFSSSPHTSLMWALELLAWNVSHLSRVILILAALTEVDTDVRIHPRPVGVLHDIFRFWYPQTAATIDERIQVLDLLAKRKPEVAWTLLAALVPQGQDTASPGSKPRWRDYDSSQIKGITYGDINRQVDWAAKRLISLASSDTAKWQVLLKDFARLPAVTQQAILEWLQAVDPASLEQSARIQIWEGIRYLVQQHRFFHAAFWALPPAKVDELAVIERKLAPDDPVIRAKWLFGYGGHHAFGDTETPYDEQRRMEEEVQSAAIQEIFEARNLTGLLELASVVTAPQLVGVLAGKLGIIPKWQEILPDKLVPTDGTNRDFALGYVGKRIAIEGDSFVENLPLEDWSAAAVAEFALAMNFERKTWDTLRRRKPEAEVIYWNRTNPHAGHLPVDEVEEAVRCLLNVRRAVVAASCVFSAYHAKKRLDWTLVADAIDAASLASGKADSDALIGQHFVWELSELMKYLQNDPAADQGRLVTLEYRFLPLAQHHDFSPKTLHGELSRNPAFFAEVIEAQFITKAESQDKNRIPDPDRAPIAEAAYKLLDSWTGIPGSRPDGSIDSSILKGWVDDARKLCAASDRIEICDVMLGDQMSCAPSDSDGTWPCEAVRDVLESVPTEEILRGFEVGVANQRGAHWKSMTDGGEQERELAKKYIEYASKVKVAWPRTALALRRLAERYESEAKREDERVEGRA